MSKEGGGFENIGFVATARLLVNSRCFAVTEKNHHFFTQQLADYRTLLITRFSPSEAPIRHIEYPRYPAEAHRNANFVIKATFWTLELSFLS